MEKLIKKLFEWHPNWAITLPISITLGAIVGLVLWCANLLSNMAQSENKTVRYIAISIAISLLVYAYFGFAYQKGHLSADITEIPTWAWMVITVLAFVIIIGIVIYCDKATDEFEGLIKNRDWKSLRRIFYWWLFSLVALIVAYNVQTTLQA